MSEINETRQRFLELGVNEVSLVDHPANQEDWLVIKRLGGKGTMTTEPANLEAVAPPQSEEQPVDIAKAEDSVKEVEPLKASTADEEVVKAMTGEQAMKLLQQVYNLLAKAFKEAYPTPEKAEETEAKKALLAIDDGQLIINTEMIEDIRKAKIFSQGRTQKLEDAVKAMIAVLQEVSPDAVAKLLGTEEQKTETKPTKKSVEPQEEPQKEDLSDKLTEAVSKAFAPLEARIKELEGATTPPKSGDPDQIAEVRKSDTDLWSGIL